MLDLPAAEIPSPRDSAPQELDPISLFRERDENEPPGLIKKAMIKQRNSICECIFISNLIY